MKCVCVYCTLASVCVCVCVALTSMAPPWRLVAMAFMINEPSRLLTKSEEELCPLVLSAKSVLKAADTWLRIWAAEVLC